MTAAIEERPVAPPLRIAGPWGLGRLLDELESLLQTMPPAVYEATPESGETRIGQHVGRCLARIGAVLSAGSARVIVYGPRARDTAVDTDPATALRRLRALRDALADREGRSLDGVICVEQMLSPFGDLDRAWSTFGHEIAFVVNHVIDSQKLISRGMASFGVSVPEEFGSMEPPPLRARSTVPPSWGAAGTLSM